ncbi:indolepyruvate ferredoxin oxidoreductase family protein [Rhodococcus sp. P1Y]|uniref:indolepyruvate ferredoxin oxidoreductase family protein n=1 Tax=Rhodococcus sp. P1Y TaxID=1302308 RepID=UPI000EAE0058|nr:indolepyruvate ferredoxin oxidoreductase family protein [Rhodococcus sp. P1Y]AYJ48092.1 indolepyruvate ferredoxin oxidoreductase family protein [Rhodococcus sp. P1Y]
MTEQAERSDLHSSCGTDAADSSGIAYDIGDRYRPGSGPVLVTGVQAIARMLVEQQVRDAAHGIRTGTFVSGYQGSPLAGFDRLLAGTPTLRRDYDIRLVPGLNEELAATSVWGSQTELPVGTRSHDSVVGVWYGKGPGLDRATDALRHGNMYGAHPTGGALLLVGDDPGAKSSSVPCVSERSLAAMSIPTLYPRNGEEMVKFGLHAIALSRASGCFVALKIIADVADGLWTIDGSAADVDITVPDIEWDGKPWTYRQRFFMAPPDSVLAEADLLGPRWAMVEAYAAANRIDTIEVAPDTAHFGIVAAGGAYDSMRQALVDLGLTDDDLHRHGIRILRVGMLYPLSATRVKEFADGLSDILVVEDKVPFLESQLREILYGIDGAPRVQGKKASDGSRLIPVDGELTAARLAGPIRTALAPFVDLRRPLPLPLTLTPLEAKRTAYFCSGCPHNRSTAVPEGSIAGGGIGCHTLVTMSSRTDSAVNALTQMGGEGAQWIGQAEFADVPHTFQNVGDGTFFHSGQLAVQACIAAGVNITYKILFNSAVAMTGAQDAEGGLSVPALTHKLKSEGVARIIICADEPERHSKSSLAPGTSLLHRDRLDDAQKELRDIPGVTVLIYDQRCAADARRQRKRGKIPARSTRVVINELVCEGCGDCGVKSNCLSVQPIDTEFGRKTRIDQSSCNTDYTCLDGDCPSFVTVEVPDNAVVPSKPPNARIDPPEVTAPELDTIVGTHNIFLAGVGGTGIVTVNQVLATAAMLAGLHVEGLDQTGLSQKAGPVTSHLRISSTVVEPSNRITPGNADCILAFDLLVAADSKYVGFGHRGRTVTAASTSKTPTGDMVYDASVSYPEESVMVERLESASKILTSIDAMKAAKAVLGSTEAANFLLVGAAYQAGGLPIPGWAIEKGITINGVAVDDNIAAFRWGQVAVADSDAFADAVAQKVFPTHTVAPAEMFADSPLEGEVLELTRRRAGELIAFQNLRVAQKYVASVENIWRAERSVTDQTEFSDAVARGLFKLTAYKDEYEVARMLTDPQFIELVRVEVPGAKNMQFKLHPPALRALGRKKKIGLGPSSRIPLKVLARGRVLRGTPLDPFGYAHVRRVERQLVEQYRTLMTDLAAALSTDNYARAVEAAEAAQLVRGYEGIKLDNVDKYYAKLGELGL